MTAGPTVSAGPGSPPRTAVTTVAPVVTALLRVSSRLLAVRTAGLYVLAAPAFVAWAGAPSQAATEARLRVAGMVAAAIAALFWEDRCVALVGATPVGLPTVRRVRGLLTAVLLALGWSLAALVANTFAIALLIETVGLVVLLTALIGWLADGRGGESIAAYPVPALLMVLAALYRLPERWNLLMITPDAAWSGQQTRWAILIALAASAVAWLGRDPATCLRTSLFAARRAG